VDIIEKKEILGITLHLVYLELTLEMLDFVLTTCFFVLKTIS